jgi:hypothetical protein
MFDGKTAVAVCCMPQRCATCLCNGQVVFQAVLQRKLVVRPARVCVCCLKAHGGGAGGGAGVRRLTHGPAL